MISNEEFFGVHAGKVWNALKAHGPMSAAKISGLTELEEHEVRGALGWLGREGKIKIEIGGGRYLYSAAE